MAVRADVLDWCRANRSRDATQGLDPTPATVHCQFDQVVPVFASLNANVTIAQLFDALVHNANHMQVINHIGHDDVAAASENQPIVTAAPNGERVLDQVIARAALDQLCGHAADADRGEFA